MTLNTINRDLIMGRTSTNQFINEFIKELGVLLSIRIAQYHRKYMHEIEFLNLFIVCPAIDLILKDIKNYNFSQTLVQQVHFEDNLNIELIYFELDNICLNKDKQIVYTLTFRPFFLNKKYDKADLTLELTGNEIIFFDDRAIDVFEEYTDDVWKKVIKKIQMELTFGTLKAES